MGGDTWQGTRVHMYLHSMGPIQRVKISYIHIGWSIQEHLHCTIQIWLQNYSSYGTVEQLCLDRQPIFARQYKGVARVTC